MNNKKLTPLQERYSKIKAGLPDNTILFMRLGNFYEAFFDDAKTAAKVLNITLTRRGDVPMAGIPYHAKDSYFAKLVSAGHQVGVFDGMK